VECNVVGYFYNQTSFYRFLKNEGFSLSIFRIISRNMRRIRQVTCISEIKMKIKLTRKAEWKN